MSDRPHIPFQEFAKTPAYAALGALSESVDKSGLEKPLTELVKLRASQMNGYAFCIQYHLNLARRHGVASEKLDLVTAWREAGVFNAREMAALAWTETLTARPQEAASDTAYDAVRAQFSDTEVTNLTVAIGTINQWNRIAVALRFAPSIQTKVA